MVVPASTFIVNIDEKSCTDWTKFCFVRARHSMLRKGCIVSIYFRIIPSDFCQISSLIAL